MSTHVPHAQAPLVELENAMIYLTKQLTQFYMRLDETERTVDMESEMELCYHYLVHHRVGLRLEFWTT